MSNRSSGYKPHEDVLLCQVYLEISQDPIMGRYQTSDQFWSRVEERYNSTREQSWECRSTRSIMSRIQVIMSDVRKLNGCLKQIENLNPSGASDEDILLRAKHLLMQDPKYKRGFKFDHVWKLVKDFEKFKDRVPTARQLARSQGVNYDSSQGDNPTPESPLSTSPGLSSFSLNLSDTSGGATSTERPIGVKKAKLKRKVTEQLSREIVDLSKRNEQLIQMWNDARAERQEQTNILRECKENKILFRDLNTISDPTIREYIRGEQLRIVQERAQRQHQQQQLQQQQQQQQQQQPQQQQQEGGSSYNLDMFAQLFNNIGESGSNLPDY